MEHATPSTAIAVITTDLMRRVLACHTCLLCLCLLRSHHTRRRLRIWDLFALAAWFFPTFLFQKRKGVPSKKSQALGTRRPSARGTCYVGQRETLKKLRRAGGLLDLRTCLLLLFFGSGLLAVGQDLTPSTLPGAQTPQSSRAKGSSSTKQMTSELRQQLDVDSEALSKIHVTPLIQPDPLRALIRSFNRSTGL